MAVSKSKRPKGVRQAPKGGYGFLSVALDALDMGPLLEALGPPARTGRTGYPPGAMLRLVLSKYILGIRFNVELLDRLRASRRFRSVCGFPGKVPSEPTLSKFTTRLMEFQPLLHECLAQATGELRDALAEVDGTAPLGETVAVDSTAVETFANPNRKVIRDPEARWGVKHSAKAKDGKTEFFFGYKVHMIADANHGTPLDFIVTPGNINDSPVLPHLLAQTGETLPWFQPRYVIGDRGYDAKTNYAAVAGIGAVPIIHIRHLGTDGFPDKGVRTERGHPSCRGWRTMQYVRTDPDTGKHLFRCPDGGCHFKTAGGRRRKGERCAEEVWADPLEDLRELGFVLRGSDEWVNLYSKRMTIERTFRSVKASRNLEGHRYRGLAKVTLHATLSILTYQATMLARVRAGDYGNLRQMRVKVG